MLSKGRHWRLVSLRLLHHLEDKGEQASQNGRSRQPPWLSFNLSIRAATRVSACVREEDDANQVTTVTRNTGLCADQDENYGGLYLSAGNNSVPKSSDQNHGHNYTHWVSMIDLD